MITPLFKVDQDEIFIYLTIKVKYVKISEVDFFIENNNFKFYLKPYFLNLHFSDNFKSDSEINSSKYDVEKGLLECKIEKETPGTEFKNLDMISTLLNEGVNLNSEKEISKPVQKKIVELSSDMDISNTDFSKNNSDNTYYNIITDEHSLNSYLIDYLQKEKDSSILNQFNSIKITVKDNVQNYGFNNEFNDVFKNRTEELMEIADLNPEEVEPKHRFFKKIEKEIEDFIPERYFYDLNLDKEDDMFQSALNLSLSKYFSKYSEKSQNGDSFQFNEKEINTLMTISKTKISLLDSDTNIYFHFYLQVIDILFAFLYDLRVTEYEHNSESGWTINKLSAVLSNFVDFKNVFYSFSDIPPYDYLEESIKHVLISNYRRVLCYPLYRNIQICEKIKQDISSILTMDKGMFFMLKFFLRLRAIFESSEPRHIFNKIYIDSFIQWIQFYSNKIIWDTIGIVVKKVNIKKEDLKLDLLEIENDFKELIEEENNQMDDK